MEENKVDESKTQKIFLKVGLIKISLIRLVNTKQSKNSQSIVKYTDPKVDISYRVGFNCITSQIK